MFSMIREQMRPQAAAEPGGVDVGALVRQALMIAAHVVQAPQNNASANPAPSSQTPPNASATPPSDAGMLNSLLTTHLRPSNLGGEGSKQPRPPVRLSSKFWDRQQKTAADSSDEKNPQDPKK